MRRETPEAATSPEVVIVYSPGCPNLRLARRRVRAALHASDRALHWREWSRESPDTPAFARAYGSPTVLVEGREVAPATRGEPGSKGAARRPDCCRLYPDGHGALEGAPSVRAIVEALRATGSSPEDAEDRADAGGGPL